MKRLLILLLITQPCFSQQTQKPPLHGKHWMAITGKPLAATAGSMVFQKGGNAVDAACAMLAATCTMWDVLSWGGETQALIYNPHTKKVKMILKVSGPPWQKIFYGEKNGIKCWSGISKNQKWNGLKVQSLISQKIVLTGI